MDTVVNENRVRVNEVPHADADGEIIHTLADELFENSAFAPTFEECLQKVSAAKRPENMRSLVARLHKGSFDRLFRKEPEKCKALKELVAAKDHLDSDALAQDSKVLTELVLAAQQVSYKLKTAFPDVGRVGLFFEGFGMNHLHAKLFPMHGTKPMKEWKNLASAGEINKKFFHRYEGYLSSHNGERADDTELAKVAEKIRNAKV